MKNLKNYFHWRKIKLKNKKVFFKPQNKHVYAAGISPKPAKNYLPKWYKEMPAFHKMPNGNEAPTGIRCIPFLDSFTSGYIYELACDVTIKHHGKDESTGEDLVSYTWAGDLRPISTRKEEFGTPNLFPNFDGYYNLEIHWNSFWEPKTPNGYSTMYHHPNNRFDLPFHTMTGIIDTDNWSIPGPVPFLIKKGFEGIITAGTPIIQTTFIKRDNWESFVDTFNEEEHFKTTYQVQRKFIGGYKKAYWSRKNYT
jgi:hypothetical protein